MDQKKHTIQRQLVVKEPINWRINNEFFPMNKDFVVNRNLLYILVCKFSSSKSINLI